MNLWDAIKKVVGSEDDIWERPAPLPLSPDMLPGLYEQHNDLLECLEDEAISDTEERKAHYSMVIDVVDNRIAAIERGETEEVEEQEEGFSLFGIKLW